MPNFRPDSNFQVIMNVRPGDAYIDPRYHSFDGEAILIVTAIDQLGSLNGYTDRIIKFDKCIPTDDTYSELVRIDKGTIWAGKIRGSKFLGKMPIVKDENGKLIQY